MKLFAKALKMGLTFSTERGNLSIQQVWQLPLTGNGGFSLKTVSRELLKEVKATQEEDLVTETNSVDADNQLRLDIIKFIIADKKEDEEEKRLSVEKKIKKQKLQELIAQKQDQVNGGKSLEELQEELANL